MASSSMKNSDESSTMNYGLTSGAVVDVGEVPPSRAQQSTTTQQQLLTTVFEQYAQQYPNPKLAEEYEQRDALLQQVAKQQQVPPLKQKRSLFGLLFKRARHQDIGGLYDTSTLNPDEWLEYYNANDENPHFQDDSLLCHSTLDTSCIPYEAFCMARFLLSCRRDVPNVARNTCTADIVITLVHVGIICSMSEHGENAVIETSDAQALQAQIPQDYDVSRARAVVLSQDVLAVSWGLSDGIVVLYQCNTQHSTWDSVAVLSPTQAVSDNLHHHGGNALIVTNVVPLRVKDPSSGGIVTTLAISRLGGYIEFIIMPELPKHRAAKRKKRGRPDEHYAANLPNISYSDTSMTALTTADYHVDVLCLESFRTSVGSDTEWDTDLFPKTPPAEHVLVASGGTNDGEQVISYWGVSILFPENIGQERASIHVSFLDGINLGTVGADVTVFSSGKMWDHWRRPRMVRLRAIKESVDDEGNEQGEPSGEDEVMNSFTLVEDRTESKTLPLSTLSTAVPITRMRLTTMTNDLKQEVVLAASGGNGGIHFIDCTAVIALAAHEVAEEELGDDSLLNLKCILPSKCLSSVADIGWLSNDASGEDGAVASPLITVIRPRMLQVVILPLSSQLGGSDTIARVSYSLDIPSLTYGATVIASTSSQCVSFLAFNITESRRKLLCRRNLERLDSSTVIVMLMKASKYAEAIRAANAMNVADSTEEIQFCHRKLWERDGNVNNLSQVTDDDYVVNETLAIFDCEEQRVCLDLATARAACLLALERVTSLTERKEELMLRLESIEAKVSTYILLCMSNEAVPQLSRFKEKFLPVPLRHLASAFASNGDVSSLTAILFRHRPELLPFQLEILDKLPLEAPPESFAHLLPVSRPGPTCFHTGEHGINGLREWSVMAHYMENMYDMRLVLDDRDEAVLLDRCRHFDNELNTLEDKSIQVWYLARAKRVHREIGSLSVMRDFLQFTSQRLNCSFASISSSADDLDPGLRELCSIYNYAMQLDQICAGPSSTLRSGKLVANALATMSLSEIGEMSVDDRVSLILGPASDPSTVLSNFRNGSVFLALGEQSDEQRERMIDSSVSVYCGNAIMNSVSDKKTSANPQQVVALRNAVGVCTEIANASRTTIHRSNRIVKDKCTLMNLVLGAAYDTSRACKNIDLSSSDCRRIIESIWESYECLPIRLGLDKVVVQSELQDRVDCLFKNLVVVDVLSRWSSAALGFLSDLDRNESGEHGHVGRAEVGLMVIIEICRSFCNRIQGETSVDAELDLLRDLISDVEQVNKIGFVGTLSLAPTLQENLIKPLLQNQAFQFIDPLANWTGRDEMRASVLEFVNEAMFNNDDAGGDRVQAAIRCQDILGPLFPELQVEFETSRHYLDASFLINRMHVRSNKVTYPCEVRDTLPLDVIESVLKENPGCILDGCSEWTDPVFSRNANEVICRHYWSVQQANAEDSSSRNCEKLPILPGSAIYPLASLLGLHGSRPLLLLKSRVVYYAVRLSEFAAAAAVCATMVNENGSSWNEKAVADCIVDSVARVVSVKHYDDLRMKITLCNAVFEKCHNELSVLDILSYETVLDSFVMLENIMSRRPQQSPTSSPISKADGIQDDMEPTVNEFLVFRAVGMVAKTARNVARHADRPSDQSVSLEGPSRYLDPVLHRVYQDILTQYSTDVPELFFVLRGVAASSREDDSLLLTLGRLIGFWCISEALRIRPQSEPLELERSNFDDVLSLGTSLLLHAQVREALVSCIAELKGIFSRETAATMERAASAAQPDSVTPDPEIVRTLVSRGYSENGARRAAAMTLNESAQVALVWAVSHTLDEGFDDPMVNVASSIGSFASGRVDQNMIHCMQETLNLAHNYVSRKCTLQSLLPAKTSLSNPPGCEEVAQNGHRKPPTKGEVVHAELPNKPRRPSRPTNGHSVNISGRKVARIVAASEAPAPKQAVAGLNQTGAIQLSRTPKTDLAVPSTASKPPPVENLAVTVQKGPPSDPKPPAHSKPAEPKISVPRSNRTTPRSLSTPGGSKVLPVDRLSTLRSHDETKTTGSNLASEERKRLIAEGRRMLREARASKATAKSSSSTTASAPAPTNRYPLRSRTPPLPDTTAHSTVTLSNPEPSRQPPPPPSVAKQDDGDSDGSGWDFDDF